MKTTFTTLALATAAALAAPMAGAQQFTMRLSNPAVNDVSHEWMKRVKAGVEQRTGGKVKVELYPASQLGQIPATVEGVALGTIEVTIPAVGFLIGLEPRFQVFDAAGLFDSVEHGQRVLDDPEVRKRTATFGASKGVEPLFVFLNGPLMMLAHRPVKSLNDFKGLKVRAPGGAPLHMEPFRKLGANPISMPLGEVLPAMQNRTIDATTASFSVFASFKYYDVSKHLTQLPGSFLVAAGLANRGFFKKLGPDLEKVVREESRKAEVAFSTWGIEDLGRIRRDWEKNGGQVYSPSPADQKRYLDDVTGAIRPIISANAQMREDYEALLAAAKRHRR